MRILQQAANRMPQRFRVAGVLVLGAAVLSTTPAAAAEPATAAPAAAQSAEDDEFRVESRRIEDYQGTREDVQATITDDLATKLRQFDEWTVDGEDKTAAEAAQQAAARAAAEARAAAAAAGGGQGGAAGGAGSTAAANAGAGPSGPNALPFDPNAAQTPTGAQAANPTVRGGQGQSPPTRPDRRSKEDDVAQMIREAAEQETDPQRRQELMDQYEAYMDSL